jgi:peptidoglycan/LPS O-acetylase OafA/YrhL
VKNGGIQASRLFDIPSLTGLRFIAAFSIALGHSLPRDAEVWGIEFHGITAIGMPIFFTLSGFIIHYSYADQFAKRRSGAIPNFAVSRFSRIYPLYWFLLMVAMVTTPMGSRLFSADGLPILAAYVLGVTTWVPFRLDHSLLAEWYYGISWSIATEMFFYVCYAIALWRIVRIDRPQTCTVTFVGFMAASFLLLWLAFSTRDAWEPLLLSADPGLLLRTQDFNNSGYRWLLYLSPYSQILAFIAGVLTCQLYRLTRDRYFAPALVSTIGWAATFGIAILWVVFNLLGHDGTWLTAQTFGAYVVNLHLNMLFVPLCCLLIYVLAIGPSSLASLLSLPVVVLLGEVSYSMYLGHPLAQGLVSRFVAYAARHLPFVPINDWIVLTMKIGAIFALSMTLYLLVEVPAKRAIRNYWRAWHAKAALPQFP